MDLHTSLFDLFSLHSTVEQIELPLTLEQIDSGLQTNVSALINCMNHRFPFTSMNLVLLATGMERSSVRALAVRVLGFSAHPSVICSFSLILLPCSCPRCGGTGAIAEAVCNVCHGNGMVRTETELPVRIPAGVPNGWGVMSETHGVRVRVQVKEKGHERFKRIGSDLEWHVKLTLKQVGNGGE